uniref:Putative ovule protein n=1 Tax=Solanum chacoense TaxID=4108 RepID=A0A0V0GZ40_SOLCH
MLIDLKMGVMIICFFLYNLLHRVENFRPVPWQGDPVRHLFVNWCLAAMVMSLSFCMFVEKQI